LLDARLLRRKFWRQIARFECAVCRDSWSLPAYFFQGIAREVIVLRRNLWAVV